MNSIQLRPAVQHASHDLTTIYNRSHQTSQTSARDSSAT